MHVVMTGGTGRLGRALGEALAERSDASPRTLTFVRLGSKDGDVTDPDAMRDAIAARRPDVVLHAAAYTDVRAAETDRAACWRVNVDGTRNVADAAHAAGARLVHVSTDYVFWGGEDRPDGGYRETDPVGPVRNYYALSKLVAEEAAHRAASALVVRTSFRPSTWAYPVAFTDVITSQDYVDVIATDLIDLIAHLDRIDDPVLHVATEPKSVFDLARRRTPDVRPGRKRDAGVDLPDDISLNVDRWRALREGWA